MNLSDDMMVTEKLPGVVQAVARNAAEGKPVPDSKQLGADFKVQGGLTEREEAKKKSIGESWDALKKSVSYYFLSLRNHAIAAMPGFFVNNSSNILGAAHVGTEVMMFKASLPSGEPLVANPKGPVDYVVRAMRRVFAESSSGSKSDIAEIKQAMKGKPIAGFIQHVRDMDGATDRVVAAKVGTLDGKGKLITRASLSLSNPWQTRSTLAGLIVWSLSALVPDKKESSEEVEQMTIVRDTNPFRYVLERFRQAIWFPQWGSHKRQMIGLGIMISGVCSLIGSWRNNIIADGIGRKYAFNASYLCTSTLTFLASLPLLFASDDQKGFGIFGSLMTGRLAFLPGSIARKFEGDKSQAAYYTASMGAFQAENWAQALIGGAEKLPDGTIVDHEEVKRRAHEEAIMIRKERRGGKAPGASNLNEKPSTLVTDVSAKKILSRLPQTEASINNS